MIELHFHYRDPSTRGDGRHSREPTFLQHPKSTPQAIGHAGQLMRLLYLACFFARQTLCRDLDYIFVTFLARSQELIARYVGIYFEADSLVRQNPAQHQDYFLHVRKWKDMCANPS